MRAKPPEAAGLPPNGQENNPASWRITRRMLMIGSLFATIDPFATLRAATADVFSRFMQVSTVLTARQDLDPEIGRRLFDALCASDAGFAGRVVALPLDEAGAAADRPTSKAILDAWYLGVVGSGLQAVCITYVAALMNRTVADVLNPPTYAYGRYGSWAEKPTAAG